AGGKNVSRGQIETVLRASAYVSDAVVCGEGRKYLAALIEMDYETVAEWARGRGLTHTGYASLAAHPEVTRLLDAELARANASLGRVEQVKAFRVLPRELDPEQEGEPVTPTRKVKRRLMLERYRDLVESMFASDEGRGTTAEGAFQRQESGDATTAPHRRHGCPRPRRRARGPGAGARAVPHRHDGRHHGPVLGGLRADVRGVPHVFQARERRG